MSKFKNGDKVRIIKACACGYAGDCCFLTNLKVEGIVRGRDDEEYTIGITKPNGETSCCHFSEDKLELLSNKRAQLDLSHVKKYKVALFLESLK
jgi:hypothetical protein